MESYNHGKKTVEFATITGEVLGSDKHSETHVSSSGGGGYVGREGGYVRASQVHSSTVTNHEFWLRTEDGKEEDVKLKGYDIPLRAGQKITLITATTPEAKNYYYSVLFNHNAGKHWIIANGSKLTQRLNLESASGRSLLYAGIAAVGMKYISGPYASDLIQVSNFESWLYAIGTFVGVMVLRAVRKIIRLNNVGKNLDSHIKKLAASIS